MAGLIKIKVDVDIDDSVIDEIKALQTYKLSEDSDMLLVDRAEVAEILARHVKAERRE